MPYFVGFLVGVVVCAAIAHSYIQAVVNKEIIAVHESVAAFKTKVDAKVAEIRSAAADKVAGK